MFVQRDAVMAERVHADEGRGGGWGLRRQAAPFLRALGELGYLVFLLTLESEVVARARAVAASKQLEDQLRSELRAHGIAVEGIYREPLAAATGRHLDLNRSFLVVVGSDDFAVGQRAGLRPIVIDRSRAGDAEVVADLNGALATIRRSREAQWADGQGVSEGGA